MISHRVFKRCTAHKYTKGLQVEKPSLGYVPCDLELQVDDEMMVNFNGVPTIIYKYHCGHWGFKPKFATAWHSELDTHPEWGYLFPYQQERVTELETDCAEIQGTIDDDDTGLGKTKIVANFIRRNFGTKFQKIIYACQPGDIYRVKAEMDSVFSENLLKPAITTNREETIRAMISYTSAFPYIVDTKTTIPAMMQFLIVKWSALHTKPMQDLLASGWKPDLVVIDESHQYNNEGSKRATALIQLLKITKYKIFMSATPIKNKVGDFFVPLNSLFPEHFPGRSSLDYRCIWINKKPTAIHPRYAKWWEETIAVRIHGIRKDQAGLPLPPASFSNVLLNVKDWYARDKSELLKDFVAEYVKVLDKLDQILQPDVTASMIIGILSQLRHWTGMMKIIPVAEMAKQWLDNTDPSEKLCIGVHHVLVRQMLGEILGEYAPLSISDEDAEEKDRIEEEFRSNPAKRLLLCSIIGGGTGRNLQFCKNAWLIERQWNEAIESQFRGRFWRIVPNPGGKGAKQSFTEADTVYVDTISAMDTLDDYLDPMVKSKKIITDSTIDPESLDIDQLQQLCRKLVESRQKWVGV